MKAKISKNEHYVRLDLSGHISYESLDQLKEICHRQFKGSRLVFNLENLKFVGSSGITDFVGLLKSVEPQKLHICSALPEFYRVFESQSLQASSFHNSSLEAHNHIESIRHIHGQLEIPTDFINNNS